jgi:biotin transporter BioY
MKFLSNFLLTGTDFSNFSQYNLTLVVYVLLPVWYQIYLGLSVLESPSYQYLLVHLWYCFVLGVSCYPSPNLRKDS